MFGKRLKDLREEKDIMQKDLAKYLNVENTTISMWENGKRVPNDEMLDKIATFFDVSIDYLLGRTEVKKIDEPYDNELDKILFSKAKDLSEEDKKAVLGVINALKKDIDKELDK